MPNPQSGDLGGAWTSSTPPSGRKPARLDDLTTTWTKDSTGQGINPRGPMPESEKAVHYTQLDQDRWRLEQLYGKQDETPRPRKNRKP